MLRRWKPDALGGDDRGSPVIGQMDPLWSGILVAVNLQTAFLSPPVAMAAFYLKGVSPPR